MSTPRRPDRSAYRRRVLAMTAWSLAATAAFAVALADASSRTGHGVRALIEAVVGIPLAWFAVRRGDEQPDAHGRQGVASPGALAVALALFAAFDGLCTLGCYASHSDVLRSTAVQRDGTKAHGTVTKVNSTTSVVQTEHSATRVSIAIISYVVRLDHPTEGVTATTLHPGTAAPMKVGDAVDLILDPSDPTYAELPGHTGTNRAVWIGFVVVTGALWFGWLAVALTQLNRRFMLRPAP